jgi:hypothetical protein
MKSYLIQTVHDSDAYFSRDRFLNSGSVLVQIALFG